MRSVTELGPAPLSDAEKNDMLNQHIPYRLSLLRVGHRPPWIKPCQHTNQAFEAGAVSGRILLSFLGIGFDRETSGLKPDQKHAAQTNPVTKHKETDDVKARDVGGEFVVLKSLSQADSEILAKFIHGVHKACAHFTLGSDHELDLRIYAEASPIIFRLMAEQFPDHATRWPSWNH